MSKKQTRRCVSVRAVIHERLYLYLQAQDPPRPMSPWIEDLVAEQLDAAGVPMPTATPRRKRKPDLPPKIGSGICEF